MALLIFSNMHDAEYVNVYIKPTKTHLHGPMPHWPPISSFEYSNNIYKDNQTATAYALITNYLQSDSLSAYGFDYELTDEYTLQVFSITIPSSIRDFWNSKAYELAIVIAVASLIWPYIKLIILLIVWLCKLHQNLRTRLILFIDQAGKWSYMDLCASVIITVVFYVHASIKLKDIDVDIHIVCEPDLGIVTFVIANLLSMAYSHMFIFWDQKYGYKHHVEVWTEQQMLGTQVNEESVEYIHIQPEHERKKRKYKVTGEYDSFHRAEIHLWRQNNNYNIFATLYRPRSMCEVLFFSLYLVSLVAVLWLIIESVFTVCAIFEVQGAVGAVIGSPANVRQYNTIQNASALPTSTNKYHSALFLCVCYWITIIVCPILTQMVLLLIWFAPMKHKYFVFLLKSIWFVQAWNAFDVFFVGTISGAIEMNVVSQWIIDSTYPKWCGEDGIISNELGMGCFNVEGTITRGTWMIGIAAMCQWYAIWFSLRTAKDIGIHGMEY
eukprot:282955_1